MDFFSGFHWIGAKLNGHWQDKIAISIPVIIEDKTHFFLLDTGSPQSFIYCNSLGSKAVTKKPGEKLEIKGSGAGLAFTHTFYCAPFVKNHEPLSDIKLNASGLLGMDFLEDKKLWLDLKNDRFAFGDIESSYTRPELKLLNTTVSTHLYLHIGLPGQEEIKAMFNSGPSLFSFITEKKYWEKLSLPGSAGAKQEITHEMQAGFQQKIILKSSPCKINTTPDLLNLKGSPVYYPDSGSEIFCFKHLDYSAIIGLNMFIDKGIYINTGSGEFGIFTPVDEPIAHSGPGERVW